MNNEKLEKILNSMTQEEINSKFFHLNGIMNEQKLNNVIKKIDLFGYINSDTDDSAYEDFVDVFYYIDEYIKEEKNIVSEFPTCVKFFFL